MNRGEKQPSEFCNFSTLSVRNNASGGGPPVAQSISSTTCTTGNIHALVICIKQPILPVTMTSAFKAVSACVLRANNSPAIAGCSTL